MAGTYTQIYIQIVFGTRNRECLIDYNWKDEMLKYISGTITHQNHKSIIVNAMPDHVHAFIGYKPSKPISDLVRDIKNNTSKFINDKLIGKKQFYWQEG